MSGARWPRILAVSAVVLAGTALRVGAAAEGSDAPLPDSRAYVALAGHLYEEGEFDSPAFERVTLFTPGTQAVAAGVYVATGGEHKAAARIAIALLGGATILLAFLIGSRLGGWWAGMAAAVLVAGYPALIEYHRMLMTEPLGAFALAAAVLALLRALDPGRRWLDWLLAGVLLGLTALVRAEYLAIGALLVLAAAVAAARRDGARDALPLAAVAAAGIVLAVAPWTIRNALVLDRFLPVADGGGRALFEGTYVPAYERGFDDADYRVLKRMRVEYPWLDAEIAALYPKTPKESPAGRNLEAVGRRLYPGLRWDQVGSRLGRRNLERYAWGDPLSFAGFVAEKEAYVWSHGATDEMNQPGWRALHLAMLALALAGLVLLVARRRREAAVLAVLFAAALLLAALTQPTPRRNLILVPEMAALAGLSLVAGARRLGLDVEPTVGRVARPPGAGLGLRRSPLRAGAGQPARIRGGGSGTISTLRRDTRTRPHPPTRIASMKGRIRYAQNGDVSIAYETFGRGERDLLFVGGFVGHIDLMRELPLANRFWERLGSFARITSFDKRGMGLSDRDPAEYTVEGVAEDMLAVLDSAGLDRVTLFGVSEGGSAATYFSATHPDRVEAMVQYGTYARMCRGPDNPEGIPVENLRRMLRRLVDEWGGSAHLEWWAPSLAGDESALEWWGRLLRAGTSRSAVDRLQEMYERLDVRELLPLVPVPSLVLWRKDDKMVPAGLSRAVAEGIPDARGIEMPGNDHLFIAGDQAALLGEIEEFMTGSRASQRAERTLATVLFTDIVGSTELAARLGDARWRELLGEHDRLARAAVEAERGWLVKSTGDGVFATFEGPGRAIAAAQRLRASAAAAGLEVRAGIHTGECERLDGDVGGIAVHIGARVSSAACGGEVLVSQTVRDLVVGSDLSFEDRGAHALKGIPGEWRLYAVTD